MCGIAGYIGQSKKPKLSFELLTQLFDHLETRGFDASGVWGTESGKNGRVIYHKEPIRSSEFIQKDFWKDLKKVKTNLMLVHARWKSRGGGLAATNSNNHPFVSADKRIGMVHNGTLEEYKYLKDRYQMLSDTDSEVLLRMFEDGLVDDDGFDDRLNGIKDIWSVISNGAMAVAFGERVDDDRRFLYLFRNEHRPLWLADLRGLLGQIFFFSSPDIWYRAISSSNELKKMCSGTQNLIELPTSQIWGMWIDDKHPMISTNDQVLKYEVEVDDKGKAWKAGHVRPVKKPKVELSVISQLDDNEKVLGDETTPTPNWQSGSWVKHEKETDGTNIVSYTRSEAAEEDTVDDFGDLEDHLTVFEPPINGMLGHEEICKQIIELVNSVETSANNSAMEGNFSLNDYQEILESLEQARVDMEGTLRLTGGQ